MYLNIHYHLPALYLSYFYFNSTTTTPVQEDANIEPEKNAIQSANVALAFFFCGFPVAVVILQALSKLKDLLTTLAVLNPPENSVERSSLISIRTFLKLASSVPLLILDEGDTQKQMFALLQELRFRAIVAQICLYGLHYPIWSTK